MSILKRNLSFFAIGAVGYGILELLWRGYTHWTMLLAGGICAVIFSYTAEILCDKPLIYKAVLCALAITSVEFIFGVIFNVFYGMKIWDYSKMPFNVLGQICLLFSAMWCGLSLVLLPIAERLNNILDVERDRYSG